MRSDTTNMINDNSSAIIITRNTWTIANGKRSSATSTLTAQTVRLYGRNKTVRVTEGDDHRYTKVREIGMLCEYDADVKQHTQENEDTFTCDTKTYRVLDVREIKWNGLTISKQCTLEEIS
jgi:hypothetical protein